MQSEDVRQQTLAKPCSPTAQVRASHSGKHLDVYCVGIQDGRDALLLQVRSAIEDAGISEDLRRANASTDPKPLRIMERAARRQHRFRGVRFRMSIVDAHSHSELRFELSIGFIFAKQTIDLEVEFLVQLGVHFGAAIVRRSLKDRQGRSCDETFDRNLLILKFRRKNWDRVRWSKRGVRGSCRRERQ